MSMRILLSLIRREIFLFDASIMANVWHTEGMRLRLGELLVRLPFVNRRRLLLLLMVVVVAVGNEEGQRVVGHLLLLLRMIRALRHLLFLRYWRRPGHHGVIVIMVRINEVVLACVELLGGASVG